MPLRVISSFIFGLFFCTHAFGQAVVLDYPIGRFQEDKPPLFFRWSLYGTATTLTLKVFRLNDDGSYDKIKNLVGRFDFLSERQVLPWTQEPLPKGKYFWTLEGYDESSPQALFTSKEDFIIEEAKDIDLTSRRYGVQLGFGRGKYISADPQFNIGFQTTPTIYGVLYRGGDNDGFWDLAAVASDFTIKGAVRQTFATTVAYSFRINSPNASRVDWFLGPSLRTFTYPRALSDDGENIETTTISQVSPGLVLSTQIRLSLKITLYTQASVDVPVFASKKMTPDLKQTGYGITSGLIFGQFWPLAFGGELQYRADKSQTMNGDEKVNVTLEGWSLVPNMVYTF